MHESQLSLFNFKKCIKTLRLSIKELTKTRWNCLTQKTTLENKSVLIMAESRENVFWKEVQSVKWEEGELTGVHVAPDPCQDTLGEDHTSPGGLRNSRMFPVVEDLRLQAKVDWLTTRDVLLDRCSQFFNDWESHGTDWSWSYPSASDIWSFLLQVFAVKPEAEHF